MDREVIAAEGLDGEGQGLGVVQEGAEGVEVVKRLSGRSIRSTAQGPVYKRGGTLPAAVREVISRYEQERQVG